MRLGILTSHPIQYQAPWFRALAQVCELEVFFAHQQTAAEQGQAGFGKAFEWDVDLLAGYPHRFLKNVSLNPSVNHYAGCDTPEIAEIIAGGQKVAELTSTLAPSAFPLPLGGEDQGEGGTSTINFQPSTSNSPKRFDAFIVNGWYLKSYMQAVRACRAAGVPVLVRGDSQLLTPRSLLKRLGMEVRQRWLLRQFDGFLTVGQRNREYLEHYGVRPEKIFFVPHFVDNDWFAAKAARDRKAVGSGQWAVSNNQKEAEDQKAPPSDHRPPATELRAQWGADAQTLVVLFVGKFIPKKRPGDILKAMALIRRRWAEGGGRKVAENLQPSTKNYQPCNYLVVFVGSGELENELREEAVGGGRWAVGGRRKAEGGDEQPPTADCPPLTVRVHFAGFKNQSELPACYAAADVLVLPSDGGETWGLVVNEAMACGLPAIVSDAVGCAPDLIDEGKTGFTFPLGDAEALAKRLMTFAEMKQAGHDFMPALAAKMNVYSLENATRGTMKAVGVVAR